ncbi:MAG TPA: M56 family metallopeptidase [Flavobacteriaceae bacterium]|nr:M56 family metallopeptidase [Flavobacteriaceae bacterium]
MEFLLKSSAVIALFFICYKVFLQRETYFIHNRYFLIAGIITALCLPFLVIPIYVEATPMVVNGYTTTVLATNTNEVTKTVDWLGILSLIYFSGLVILTLRLVVQLVSLQWLLKGSKRKRVNNFKLVETSKDISPFSFFNYIVYNPNMFDSQELEHIIAHEKAHAKQWHSADVLLMQLACIVLWFNPLVWLYKKDMEQNLEFIADKTAQNQAHCNKAYQHLLLKTTMTNNKLALTNNFYNSLIKKRIVMLHKHPSQKRNQWKLLLVLPLLTAFAFTFNTKVVAQSPDKKVKVITVKDEVHSYIVTKNSKDSELNDLENTLKDKGVSLSFKGIDRNKKGEITAIKINAASKKDKVNYITDGEEPISDIVITYYVDKDKITIGNKGSVIGRTDIRVSGDNEKEIVVIGKPSKKVRAVSQSGEEVEMEIEEIEMENGNTYVITSDDGSTHKVSKTKKVIEIKTDGDDDEIIEVKGDAKVMFISKEVMVEDDGKKEIRIISGDSIFVNKTNAVQWIEKDDNEEVFVIGKGKSNVFISDAKDPLIFIDGKEATKAQMNELDPKKIKEVNVLKGEKAVEKHGKKAEDGVIEITTK